MKLPVIPTAIPRMGNRLSRAVGHAVLNLMGWRFEGEFPNHRKMVVIVAPHTSNWDFVIGMAVLLAAGVKIHWLGKHTIFKWPFRRLLHQLGGIPIDRRSSAGAVQKMIETFARTAPFILGLSPEGTRKHVTRWKTGFYHIAAGADVPIVLAYMDYARKTVGLGPVILPSDNARADFDQMIQFFAQITPKNPDKYCAKPQCL